MNKQEMKFWARVFENAPNMSTEVMQGWIDSPRALENLLSGLVTTKPCLTALTSLTIASNTINLSDFFTTREGLWVSNCFSNLILSSASKKQISAEGATIGYADLARAANDEKIGAELPKGCVFYDVDMFLVRLATLIEGQWGGKSGELLNNGRFNMFYVEVSGLVFMVRVFFWSDGYLRWNCSAARLNDDEYWGTGFRVFSATAA